MRSALRHVLDAEAGSRVVAEAASGDRAIAEARRHQPDVIVMDLQMPTGDAVDHMPAVLRAAPQARILVLSMRDEPATVRSAFAAGASGYVLKEAADTELVTAVRAVAAGQQYVQAALGARLLAARRRLTRGAQTGSPSANGRWLACSRWATRTPRSRSILWISPRTAETHRAHVMRKLGLSTRAELVQYAIRTRLLDEEPGQR